MNTSTERISTPVVDELTGIDRATRRRARKWVEPLARIGFASKSAVYLMAGALVLAGAFDAGEQAVDSHRALEAFLDLPLGPALLVGLALGLAGYAVWRVAQAIFDIDCKGSDLKALAVRGAYLASGVVYAGLAVTAVRELLGVDSEGSYLQRVGRQLLTTTGGTVLVGCVGAGVIGWGVFQFYKAIKGKHRKQFLLERMSALSQRAAAVVALIGQSTRGAIALVAGGYIVSAALDNDASDVHSFGSILRELYRLPFGGPILFVTGLGLLAYAIFWYFNFRYRMVGKREDGADR